MDVNAADSEGWTALHWAAGDNHVGTMDVLIAAGADVDAKTAGGKTLLHYAAESGDNDALRILLQRGANTEEVDVAGKSALHLVCSGVPDHAVEAVDLLLRAGASESAADLKGNYAYRRDTGREGCRRRGRTAYRRAVRACSGRPSVAPPRLAGCASRPFPAGEEITLHGQHQQQQRRNEKAGGRLLEFGQERGASSANKRETEGGGSPKDGGAGGAAGGGGTGRETCGAIWWPLWWGWSQRDSSARSWVICETGCRPRWSG